MAGAAGGGLWSFRCGRENNPLAGLLLPGGRWVRLGAEPPPRTRWLLSAEGVLSLCATETRRSFGRAPSESCSALPWSLT